MLDILLATAFPSPIISRFRAVISLLLDILVANLVLAVAISVVMVSMGVVSWPNLVVLPLIRCDCHLLGLSHDIIVP